MRQAQSARHAAFALLEPACEARHAVSADAVRRADPLLLGELADRALERSGVAPFEVAMVVGDTGHRANRVFELVGFASINLPQLDGIGEVGCVGTAMGACGVVPFVAALALARHHALGRAAPVLFVSNEDPYRRTVAVVRPPLPVDNSLDKLRVNGG